MTLQNDTQSMYIYYSVKALSHLERVSTKIRVGFLELGGIAYELSKQKKWTSKQKMNRNSLLKQHKSHKSKEQVNSIGN